MQIRIFTNLIKKMEFWFEKRLIHLFKRLSIESMSLLIFFFIFVDYIQVSGL